MLFVHDWSFKGCHLMVKSVSKLCYFNLARMLYYVAMKLNILELKNRPCSVADIIRANFTVAFQCFKHLVIV